MALTLAPGAVLGGRYRLQQKLGEGGMGVVWAALDTAATRLVAVKVLTPVADPAKLRDMQRRLRREAQAASLVQHPNLCATLDVIELEDGSPALVMEHLQGETLGDRLTREHRIALRDFAVIFRQVLAGVGAVHAHGIIHRDLKPENVFLVEGPEEAVKVLDFGVAKLSVTDQEVAASSLRTATGAVLGTPCYMSPEQFGERDIDLRTDVWSLGLLAYRALSGVLPTHGGNVFEVFRRIVDSPLPPLETAAPGLPPDVTGIVGRMLARRRDDRPGDLREAMEVFARHAGAAPLGIPAPLYPERPLGPAHEHTEIDALATTYDAILVEAPRAPLSVIADAPAPEAPSDVARSTLGSLATGVPPPLAPEALGGARRRRVVLRAGMVAAAIGGLWVSVAPRAPIAPTQPDAGASDLVAPPAPPASDTGAVVRSDATATATAAPAVSVPPSSRNPAPPQRTARPGASGPAARHPASAGVPPASAPAPQPVPKGGLVEDPPF